MSLHEVNIILFKKSLSEAKFFNEYVDRTSKKSSLMKMKKKFPFKLICALYCQNIFQKSVSGFIYYASLQNTKVSFLSRRLKYISIDKWKIYGTVALFNEKFHFDKSCSSEQKVLNKSSAVNMKSILLESKEHLTLHASVPSKLS